MKKKKFSAMRLSYELHDNFFSGSLPSSLVNRTRYTHKIHLQELVKTVHLLLLIL